MRDKMKVRCEKNGADYTAPFTDGKIYEATHYMNSLWEVHDDLGHSRFITPGAPCPHLQKQRQRGRTFAQSECVGRFVPVAEQRSGLERRIAKGKTEKGMYSFVWPDNDGYPWYPDRRTGERRRT